MDKSVEHGFWLGKAVLRAPLCLRQVSCSAGGSGLLAQM